MSERKVINKYYPPNFDPSRIPKGLDSPDKQHTVRLMTPFSMRCSSCGEYIYKGRKFNARKETVEGERYLRIKIYRFYIRCPQCAAEITYKTDPKNADYVCEQGAKRNFEPWREEKAEADLARRRRELEERFNPMKALENKSFDSKREIEISEALDENRMLNARLDQVDTDSVFDQLVNEPHSIVPEEAARQKRQDAEDDAIIQAAFRGAQRAKAAESAAITSTVTAKDLLLGVNVHNGPASTNSATPGQGQTSSMASNGLPLKRKLDAASLGIVPKKKSS